LPASIVDRQRSPDVQLEPVVRPERLADLDVRPVDESAHEFRDP